MANPSAAVSNVPVVRVARVVGAPAAECYKAWVDSARKASWWGATEKGTLAECKMDVRAGGAFRFVMRHPGSGVDFVASGLYIELNPPYKLVSSWTSESFPDVAETRVTVSFVDMKDNTCRVVITHEGIKSPLVRAAHQSMWSNKAQDLAQHFVVQ